MYRRSRPPSSGPAGRSGNGCGRCRPNTVGDREAAGGIRPPKRQGFRLVGRESHRSARALARRRLGDSEGDVRASWRSANRKPCGQLYSSTDGRRGATAAARAAAARARCGVCRRRDIVGSCPESVCGAPALTPRRRPRLRWPEARAQADAQYPRNGGRRSTPGRTCAVRKAGQERGRVESRPTRRERLSR